nr:ATP-binding protein [Thiocystis violacea]
MAVLGSLTAGVAHELNNPIGFVKNNTVMLEEYLQVLLPVLREVLVWSREPEGLAATLGERIASASGGEDLEPILDDLAPLLADTREGAQRLEDIVGGLRSFARADTPEGEPFDINQCVKDALKVAWNELKYKATVVQSMTEVQVLNGKPGEIKQVILNLLVNASQALADYGEIRLGTRQLDGEVEFFIADTGTGIAQEHLERLFTPFFTTKPAGKGTGLGLSISRDIVTAHGGRIEVTSKLGEGSEFRVFLPIPQDDP